MVSLGTGSGCVNREEPFACRVVSIFQGYATMLPTRALFEFDMSMKVDDNP